MYVLQCLADMVSEELDRDRPLFDACIPVEVKRPELLERKEVCMPSKVLQWSMSTRLANNTCTHGVSTSIFTL